MSVPYFVHMDSERYNYDFVLCLYHDNTPTATMCAHKSKDFDEAVAHLFQAHNLALRAGIDYCRTCAMIFRDFNEGMEHYFCHLLQFQEFGVIADNAQPAPATLAWREKLFLRLREDRDRVMEYFLYGDDANSEVDDTEQLPPVEEHATLEEVPNEEHDMESWKTKSLLYIIL